MTTRYSVTFILRFEEEQIMTDAFVFTAHAAQPIDVFEKYAAGFAKERWPNVLLITTVVTNEELVTDDQSVRVL
jgi:hypothetical protein